MPSGIRISDFGFTENYSDHWSNPSQAYGRMTIIRLLYQLFIILFGNGLGACANDTTGPIEGMIGGLQTWDCSLNYHPHVYYLVPAGEVDQDGNCLADLREQLRRFQPGEQTPIDRDPQANHRPTDEVLCPVCGQVMKKQILFPGHVRKPP